MQCHEFMIMSSMLIMKCSDMIMITTVLYLGDFVQLGADLGQLLFAVPQPGLELVVLM